jgi:hypothetical protein
MTTTPLHCLVMLLSLAACAGSAAGVTAAPEDAGSAQWPDWDTDWDLEERVAEVNDGELRLLPPEAVAGAHRHHTRIDIGRSSLREGWVSLEQCHTHLDPVPAAEVVFDPKRIRGLRVTGSEGIERAWVEGHTVQLEDVGRGARLCIAAQSRALRSLGQGRYRLQNGPFMRRFLDGYYPMQVVLDIRYPADVLRFEGSGPAAGLGFRVRREPGSLGIEADFEGRLYTCMDFLSVGDTSRAEPAPACPSDAAPVAVE